MMKYKTEIIIVLLGSFSYLLFNWALPITDPVEANYALTAKEMLLQGDYLNTIIYGQYWYDKPIFIYWALIASYKLFGLSAFAARFPMGIVSGLSLAFSYWFVMKLYGNRKIALYTVMVLATSLEFWVLGKMIITDSMLFLFDSIALGGFYLAMVMQKKRYMYLGYAGSAFAVLTKGPVGIVLPILIVLAYCLVTKQVKRIKPLLNLKGILLFFIIALPWYVYMYAVHGMDFINGFLGLHNVTRALVSEHPKDNFYYYYLIVFPLSLLPWSLIFIKKVWHSWKEKSSRGEQTVYLYCWIMVTLLFYTSIATKYPTYVFIAVFPAAILIAEYLVMQSEVNYKEIWQDLAVSITVIIGILYILLRELTLPWNDNILLAYGLLLSSFILLLFLRWGIREKCKMIHGFIGVNLLVILTATGIILPQYSQSRSSADLAVYLPTNAIVASFGDYQNSLLFYQQTRLIKLEDDNSSSDLQDVWQQKYKMPHEKISAFAKETVIGDEVYIIVTKKDYERFETMPISDGYEEVQQGNRDILLRKK